MLILNLIQNNFVFRLQKSPELSMQFMPDVQSLQLLQAIDRYLIHVRKLKHIKSEAVKANFTAAKERSNRQITAATVKDRATRLTTAKTEITVTKTEMTGKESKVMTEIKEKEMAAEIPESTACNSFIFVFIIQIV